MSSVAASSLPQFKAGRWSSAGRLIWLSYLFIYPTPWLGQPPSRMALVASSVGFALFLASFAHAYFRHPRSLLPDVLLMAAIGFALSPFGGAWSVFSIFAIALAARVQPLRDALIVVALLLLSLPVFGLAFDLPWFGWASGIAFGALAATGTFFQTDLERRNRRLLEAQVEVRSLAASAERERIARDLHDLLGHTLTLVAIKADLAVRLSLSAPERAKQEMEEVVQAARDALGEVRLAVAGMRGASLALEIERAGQALAASGIAAELPCVPSGLESDSEAVLAMVLREAVTNVVRHAGARFCRIALTVEADDALLLRVEDDGTAGQIVEGAGLAGMRARLAAAGGTMLIENRAAGQPAGIVLLARLPRLNRSEGTDLVTPAPAPA